ncbi:protein of unknown function [Burkholderia sp. D7]|nr:protein of unknown function [Burkholderia sp. D7]
MKRTLFATVLLSALTLPAVAFAQTDAPLTRAQVRNELVEMHNAGYVADTDASYPTQVMAAEQRVATRRASGSYGPTTNGTSASGGTIRATEITGLKPIYFGQ